MKHFITATARARWLWPALFLGSATPAFAQVASDRSCDGRAAVGYIGITAVDCSCTISSPGGRPWSFRTEPKIAGLESGTRAAALLKRGDVITAVNGKLITTREGAEELENILPGQTVILSIRRDGQSLKYALTADAACPNDSRLLGNYTPAPPSSYYSYSTGPTPAPRGYGPTAPPAPSAVYSMAPGRASYTSPRATFGMGLSCSGNCSITFIEKNRTAIMAFSQPPEVYSIERGGPADKAGIRRGDLITHINGKRMDSDEGGKLFANTKPGETVQFTVRRNNEQKTFSVRAAERATPTPSKSLAETSSSLERAKIALAELQREQNEQMKRLAQETRRLDKMAQEDIKELHRQLLREEQENRSKMAQLANEMSKAERQMRSAMTDASRSSGSCQVPLLAPGAATTAPQTLRYTGTIGRAEIEVRGSHPVSVSENDDGVTITTGGTVVKIKKSRD